MADTERPLSFLPTIKCSSCGVDIQISQLADHICALSPTTSNNTAPTSPPKLDRAATFGGSRFNNASSNQFRPGRIAPPPRIDPSAANKPFGVQTALSPSPMSNYSDPKSLSPLLPRGGRSPFKMNRSATSPIPRSFGPPSPDLSSNLDCAFPPFPSQRSATPSSARPRYKEKDRPDQKYKHKYVEADPLYAPRSPRVDGGENVTRKMDAIAPGPFDGRRPSTSNGKTLPPEGKPEIGHRRTATQGSIASNRGVSNQRTSVASNRSLSSTFSSDSIGLPSRPKPGQGAMNAMAPPPRPPMPEGIDAFLDRLQKETMQPTQIGPDSRSKTFPLRKESNDASGPSPRPRRPSETSKTARRPTEIDTYESPRSNNMFPARSTSRGGSKSGRRPDELAPPLPPMPGFGKELPQKPLHTPSDSGLSDDSTSSSGFRSAASSRSSPPASEASPNSRSPSKTGRPDFLDEPIQRVASPDSYNDPAVSRPTESDNVPAGYNRGKAPEPLLQAPSPLFADAPESPLDPAIQRGLLYQKRPEPPKPTRDPAVSLSQTPPRDTSSTEQRETPKRRPTAASKGNCRGCGEAIIGKSVKDSSGRLTGRYHKQCFVCRTCRSPFPGAEFYVFNNFPYCEQHYHQLNGSLCKSCNRGIEGQYLETDQRQKFHPKCFTCFTCRVVLRDDYYEVEGKPYCDRHAYHASKQGNFLGPGGNRARNMQKRSTRLMMMI
ncbi:hypothetical protein BDV96DRAFT_648565 [Lophiotrema nucula]|uniref:LIM zinc-binding domain-containing protein n=1 Tax=Lophiotrema nucula TaxID=690887 RepID=A0A6A5Z0H6_9PLEO|nr:hypothetical protein BDV96DRAFT_648565 [Lophiotrema nucula]